MSQVFFSGSSVVDAVPTRSPFVIGILVDVVLLPALLLQSLFVLAANVLSVVSVVVVLIELP